MLTEAEVEKKLRDNAGLFEVYIGNKDWGRAHAVYLKTLFVATFLQVPDKLMAELFGHYDRKEDEEEDTALFSRADVSRVDREACVKRNMAYQDMACRKAGQPVKYYSEPDYCAVCEHRKTEHKKIS